MTFLSVLFKLAQVRRDSQIFQCVVMNDAKYVKCEYIELNQIRIELDRLNTEI